MNLTKDKVLSANDLPVQEVPIPEWGGSVFVRTMMGDERDAFEIAAMNGDGLNRENFRARLAVATVVDADGGRMFDDSDKDALGKKSSAALDRIMSVALKMNGMSPSDVEDMVENFEPGQNDDSSSG